MCITLFSERPCCCLSVSEQTRRYAVLPALFRDSDCPSLRLAQGWLPRRQASQYLNEPEHMVSHSIPFRSSSSLIHSSLHGNSGAQMTIIIPRTVFQEGKGAGDVCICSWILGAQYGRAGSRQQTHPGPGLPLRGAAGLNFDATRALQMKIRVGVIWLTSYTSKLLQTVCGATAVLQ